MDLESNNQASSVYNSFEKGLTGKLIAFPYIELKGNAVKKILEITNSQYHVFYATPLKLMGSSAPAVPKKTFSSVSARSR